MRVKHTTHLFDQLIEDQGVEERVRLVILITLVIPLADETRKHLGLQKTFQERESLGAFLLHGSEKPILLKCGVLVGGVASRHLNKSLVISKQSYVHLSKVERDLLPFRLRRFLFELVHYLVQVFERSLASKKFIWQLGHLYCVFTDSDAVSLQVDHNLTGNMNTSIRIGRNFETTEERESSQSMHTTSSIISGSIE